MSTSKSTRAAFVVAGAAGIGLVATLLLFIVGVVMAVTADHSVTLPGVLTYTVTPDRMELGTSSLLPVTWLALSVVAGLPLAYRLGRRTA